MFILIITLQAVSAQRFYRTQRLPISTRSWWETAPVPYNEGIVFTSNRTVSSFVKYTNENNQAFTDIYFSKRTEENSWGIPEFLSEKFVSNFDDGPVTFARNNQLICFYRAYVAELGEVGRRSNPNGGFYFAEFIDGEWTDPVPFEHNDYDYSFYTPHLTEDGLNLYFAANLDDSRGDYDIYVSRFENNRWTMPENLGDNVNTSQRDWYPFVHSSGRLYFSSDGHDMFGGYDIFYCNQVDGEYYPAVKMQTPINSASDDNAIHMSDDFSEGYFTSKRIGGTPGIYQFSTSFPTFEFPRPIQKQGFCFRLRENSLDTIDYEVFDYEWVINDTLKIKGHNIIYCFPGAGEYYVSFNVTNKLTDSVMYDVASLYLPIRLIEQPAFTCPDTVNVNDEVVFSAEKTYLPNFEIDGYYWDFGDGMKGSGITTRNLYTSPGTYKVVLGVEERVRNRRHEPERKAVFKEIIVLPGN